MKKMIFLLSLPFVTSPLISCSSPAPKADNSAKEKVVKSASTGGFQLRPYREAVLENGLKIFFVRETSLPRLSLNLMVKTGSLQEAKDLAGLNSLTANLLEQGTQSRSALQLADEFGALGTSLGIDTNSDFTTISADSLSISSEKLLTLFSDVVMNPAFKDAEILRVKSQMIAMIQKKVDNPSNFASDRMDAFLYGDHPYGRDVMGTVQSVRKIKKQNVIRHYLSFYKPNNASLAVVGNFDEAFEKNVEALFSKWTKRNIPEVKWAAAPAMEGVQVKLLVKKGLQQTQIRIASIGVARSSDKFLPLRLSNESLGGSFASRLNQKIRDDLGLTYSIGSSFDARKDSGDFTISTFTKNESAGQTLQESLNVLDAYVKSGATDAETAAARSQLVGQFPRAIETPDRFAYNLMVLDFMGISNDYLKNFIRNVGKIKSKSAQEAFGQTVNPGQLKILVYGDEAIIPQFEKWKPEIEKIR